MNIFSKMMVSLFMVASVFLVIIWGLIKLIEFAVDMGGLRD